MDYPEFREELLKAVKEMLPDEITAKAGVVEKLNGTLRHSISIAKQGTNFSQNIYLEPFYMQFCQGGDLERLAGEVISCFDEEMEELPEICTRLDSYSNAKPHIFARLIQRAANEKLLLDVPHRVFMDFAMVPYMEIKGPNMFKGSVLLRNNYLDMWQVSEEEVLDWAILQSRNKGLLFQSMRDMFPAETEQAENGIVFSQELYVMTNQEKFFGSNMIYFEENLEHIACQLGEDFYLLPSSVHEWIIIAESMVNDTSYLLEMVRDINDTIVLNEEILGYKVYKYERCSQKIQIFG